MIQTTLRIPSSLSVLGFLSLNLLFCASQECTLYLAPSSQSQEDQVLFGVYAGIDYHEGDRIGPYELGIPVMDIDLHNYHRIIYDKQEDSEEEEDEIIDPNKTLPSDYFDIIAESLWAAEPTGAYFESVHESDEGNVMMSIPGIAMLARQSPSIILAQINQAWTLNRTLATDGVEKGEVSHPGRGAYSNYAPIVFESSHFIAAGSEIFINYGGKDEKKESYTEIDQTIQVIQTFFSKHQDQLNPLQRQQLYSFFLNDVLPYSGENTNEVQTDMVKSIPTEVSELTKVLKRGGSFVHNNPQVLKSPSWLKEFGQCMDGLYPGISTIPNAGRGAFAKRNVSAGQIIAPMPLLMIDDKTWLNMFTRGQDLDEDGKPELTRDDMDDPILVHKQLLLNYCYGHPESSLLFHPMGSVVNLINHKPTGKGANVKIVWSQREFYKQDLFDEPMKTNKSPDGNCGVGLDLVAISDIRADEEVFLDYGPEWERAWKEHIESWADVDFWPLKASDVNKERLNDPFFTKEEREELVNNDSDPYPENVETICQIIWVEKTENDETVLSFDESAPYEELWTSGNMYRCDVLQRDVIDGGDIDDVNDYFYTVATLPSGDVIENVPHVCIRFGDKAYTSDMHSPEAFRQPIGIPDSIFPEAWRDLRD